MYYPPIKHVESDTEKKRTVKNILALKARLNSIPVKTTDKNILIATWNIREFDSSAYGARVNEAIYYIAEVVNRFDLIAVQEVRDDLAGLKRVMKLLGKWWKVIYTDTTEGAHGNHERLAFVYDSRKLKFTGLAGEAVIPEIEVREKGKKTIYKPSEQLFRTPFIVSFQAGWFNFMISTAHIVYGDNVNDSPKRIKEIGLLSDFLAKKVKGKYAESKNLILLGDFNIFKPGNKTFKMITKNFTIPKAIQNLPSNAPKNKHYDQIALRLEKNVKLTNAGVFDYFDTVFRVEDEKAYINAMGKSYYHTSKGKARNAKSKSRYYKTYWRTHQMSDHLPMWVEFDIDYSVGYLKGIT